MTQTRSEDAHRKPRIALMGEFSAGKSTLMNLLLGCDPMPVRITATRVPPVWVTHGAKAATRILEDGSYQALEVGEFATAPVEGTRLIQLTMDADILELCDLIDIPGISDPNMKHDDWLDLLEDVDCVLWCTHATQAWRQSEEALWEHVAAAVPGPNFLIVTQFDKLRTERDQARVLRRLGSETEAKFAAILPIATLEAMNAGQDEDAWQRSGGAALISLLVQTFLAFRKSASTSEHNLKAEPLAAMSTTLVETPRTTPEISSEPTQPEKDDEHESAQQAQENKVTPRRVRPKPGTLKRSPAPTQRTPSLQVISSIEEP